MRTDFIGYGDVREVLPGLIAEGIRVDTVVTSPPYWGLRDYGVAGQLGLEPSIEAYIADLCDVFELVRQILSDRGTIWINLGDSYVAQRKGRGGKDKSTLSDPDAPKRKHTDSFFVRYSRRSWLRRKNLIGLPWRVALALQDRGWILRDCIIWNKPNPMPESVKDRCTKSHEYIFMLTKGPKYYYDAESIKEPAIWREPNAPDKIRSPHGQGYSRRAVAGWATGSDSHDPIDHNRPVDGQRPVSKRDKNRKPAGKRRNRRSVWTVSTEPYKGPHFATFPMAIAAPCVLAGCPPGGTVLDPFIGTGTVASVAKALGRHWIGIELNEAEYRPLIEKRLTEVQSGMEL